MPRRRFRGLRWVLCACLAVLAVPATALAAPTAGHFPAPIEALASYDPQKTCSPTAKPGTVALRSLVLAAYKNTGDYGIVRDCAVGGVSEHKEGRAWDWKVNAFDPAQDAAARDLLDWLLARDAAGNQYAMARRLGVMYVIYNRHMWSAYNAGAGWRPYTGANPHTDHVHVSLSWPGADGRTSYWGATASSSTSPIDARWNGDAAVRTLLGPATGTEQVQGDVRWRAYQNGRMYWTQSTGARYVVGAILVSYLRAGGHTALGVPTTDETATADRTGRYNHFSRGGSVYWSPTTGAHAVWGAIRDRWLAAGGERTLGYPTTDETATADRTGRYNHFSRGGSVYWSPTTGAHAVWGAIRNEWLALGAERSPLGYPVTGEAGTADGTGRYNHFSKAGSVYWTAATGPRAVWGPARERWAALGWERGYLGYPTRSEHVVPEGRRTDFVGGTVTVTGTGVVDRRW
jgi:hypothetical protein